MVAEQFFTNSFAVDGIVPEEYGHRTVLEYRSRFYTTPPRPAQPLTSPSPDHMDVIRPTDNDINLGMNEQDQRGTGFLCVPDPAEAEHVLRHLGNKLDVPGMGCFDPRYFTVLRLVPPMYLRNRVGPVVVQTRPSLQKTPFSSLIKTAMEYIVPSRGKRDTEMSMVSWHWASDLIAVATGPHLDRICAYNFANGETEIPGQRIPALEGIRCIAFRPFAGRALAAGCNAGIALLLGQRLDFLKAKRHTQIVSLDWSPDGSQLATASATDGTVRLWDVGARTSVFVDYGSIVRFSPGGRRRLLFIASPGSCSYRLWCLDSWKPERWGGLSGPVAAVTWSQDGSTIFFSAGGESAIHVLSVAQLEGEETHVVHTEVTSLPREGPGGTPTMLELDSSGERLAVAYELPEEEDGDFTDSIEDDALGKQGRFAVAVFATRLRPMFEMNPAGYVSGPKGSGPPVALKFKATMGGGTGAILTCMWKSGEVTLTQLIFNQTRQ